MIPPIPQLLGILAQVMVVISMTRIGKSKAFRISSIVASILASIAYFVYAISGLMILLGCLLLLLACLQIFAYWNHFRKI